MAAAGTGAWPAGASSARTDEPLLLPPTPSSAGIEAINRDVIKSFANFHLGQDILKQVLTQLLLYYTRFLDLVKTAFPQGAPFAQFALSIPTLMNEIRSFSRNF